MNDGAFPTPLFDNEVQIDCLPGLTKRELFAALALAGLLAEPGDKPTRIFAEIAVEAADALIRELKAPAAK